MTIRKSRNVLNIIQMKIRIQRIKKLHSYTYKYSFDGPISVEILTVHTGRRGSDEFRHFSGWK